MAAKPKKCRLHVYVSPEAAKAVRLRAERRHLTISDIIEEAIFGGPPPPEPTSMESWRMPPAPIGSLLFQR